MNHRLEQRADVPCYRSWRTIQKLTYHAEVVDREAVWRLDEDASVAIVAARLAAAAEQTLVRVLCNETRQRYKQRSELSATAAHKTTNNLRLRVYWEVHNSNLNPSRFFHQLCLRVDADQNKFYSKFIIANSYINFIKISTFAMDIYILGFDSMHKVLNHSI